MKSILDALTLSNSRVAGLRDTLVKGREALARMVADYPDLADSINPRITDLDEKIAALDSPLDPQGLAALAVTVLGELKQVGTLKFTPTPHASSGI